MEHIKITRVGKDTRLQVGFTYSMERLNNGYLRLTSVGGKFSTLVNPDTTDIEFEVVDTPASPLKGWRNTYAVNLWNAVYLDGIQNDYSPADSAEEADLAVAEFKARWEGNTFLHQVEQAA